LGRGSSPSGRMVRSWVRAPLKVGGSPYETASCGLSRAGWSHPSADPLEVHAKPGAESERRVPGEDIVRGGLQG
jgi:hypothetical protein